ncbi:MAG: uracil-DNA glycosylase family protein, partial [Pyrinomonadaceae bacterium]
PADATAKIEVVAERAEVTETIAEIHAEIGPDCTRCKLSQQGRTQVVNSVGNPGAQLMFCGEAPGADEDRLGEPFVGRAGQLLTDIIEKGLEMSRKDVFIGNINRCRPPGNRAPEADECSVCKPFLIREIAVVRPKVIVVLGATAAQNLLETKTPIGKLRGKFHDYLGSKVMPTFHPAYLLRDPNKKREVWEDMKLVKDYLRNN